MDLLCLALLIGLFGALALLVARPAKRSQP
jgi:hypothetical protein